jgi:snRNA-activating protein complex subunit 3
VPDLEDWDVLTNGIPDGVNLATLKQVSSLGGQKKYHLRTEKETNHLPSEEVRAMLWSDRKAVEPIEKPEAVLTIAINPPSNWRVRREYLLLSSQPLYALRDCIVCLTDHIVTTDHSDNPSDTPSQIRSKERCKSGFFFIENVFYNDMRDPMARDYSQVIMEWARDRLIKTPNVGNMTSRSMEYVTFQDLDIRLGFPYLYCHQGSCEHLITFKDLRLLHHSDPQNRLDYPHMIFRSREYKTRCGICNLFLARYYHSLSFSFML